MILFAWSVCRYLYDQDVQPCNYEMLVCILYCSTAYLADYFTHDNRTRIVSMQDSKPRVRGGKSAQDWGFEAYVYCSEPRLSSIMYLSWTPP